MLNAQPINTYAINSNGYVYGVGVDAGFAFAVEGEGYVRVRGDSASSILLATDGSGYRRFRGEGEANIALATDGYGYRRLRGDGEANVIIESEGEGQQVEPASGNAQIVITQLAVAYTAGHVDLEGADSNIVFGASGDIRPARAAHASAVGIIELRSHSAQGNQIHYASGESSFEMGAQADADVRGRVYGQGGSNVIVSALRAKPTLWLQVYPGAAEAAIELSAESNIPGRPIIGSFEPAPERRGMIVPEEKRTIVVTKSLRAA